MTRPARYRPHAPGATASRGWRFGAVSAGLGGVLFAGVALIFTPGDLARLVVMTAAGLCLGLLAAPVIEPKAFKRPALVQTLCGAWCGGALALLVAPAMASVAFGALTGGLLGWLAPAWLRYVTLP